MNLMNTMKPKKTVIVNDKVASPSEAPAGLKGKLFRNQFKKSQLCHYHSAGKCKSGTACPFAHDASELTQAPDLTKTSMCKAFIAGNCDNSSDECKFAHGEEDLRTTPLFEVRSLGKQIQKNTPDLGTPCIHEFDMPPLQITPELLYAIGVRMGEVVTQNNVLPSTTPPGLSRIPAPARS